jgi:predicted nuclease of predicted toxin-antitoxin system
LSPTPRFLVDAQLPPALARWLVERQYIAEHVFDLGMAGADDRDIWAYAQQVGAVIITKDEDFAERRARVGVGPSIVWVRVGNVSRRDLLTWFQFRLAVIVEALGRGETLVEIV